MMLFVLQSGASGTSPSTNIEISETGQDGHFRFDADCGIPFKKQIDFGFFN